MPLEKKRDIDLQQWEEDERRTDENSRRDYSERREPRERRFDRRDIAQAPKRSIMSWLRSFSNARLGVDRRKAEKRRLADDRRSRELQSLLTPEEIAALLQE